ncbi:MAG: type II toxin-antitoxin system VapB family antitoxin [Limisphaerales bacterium]
MKTTIDIPEKVLAETIRHTGAKTKKEAVLTAVEKYNKLRRLAALNARVHGSFKGFMTQADLRVMREDAKWGAMK